MLFEPFFFLSLYALLIPGIWLQGARTRDVYLTKGSWIDVADPAKVYEGGQWHRVPAPLNKLPCFQRLPEGKEEPNVAPTNAMMSRMFE